MGSVGVTTLHPQGRGIQSSPRLLRQHHPRQTLLEGDVQRWHPVVYHSYEYGILVPLLGRKTQAAKVIGGELQATEMNGAAQSEADASRVVDVGNEREFQ
jgi:hypothetical protein